MKITNSIKNLNRRTNVRFIQFTFPIEFYGGNINIISMENSCNLTNDIKIKNRFYDLTVRNKSFNELNFITNCIIQNRSSGQWNVTIPESEIIQENEKMIKNEINELEKIAKEIIDNDNSEVPVYIKICKWVYNNIKYNLSYTGKNLTPLQIYRIKTGVCHHMTILFNSLLYSIGYLTIYVYGFVIDQTFPIVDESGPHAWSLVKINNKWIPFDSTWGIWSGNLPTCHIYSNYFNKDTFLYSGRNDYVQTDYRINGKYIS
jgi:transglutaminase/protease-like cytokinesis protein 3